MIDEGESTMRKSKIIIIKAKGGLLETRSLYLKTGRNKYTVFTVECYDENIVVRTRSSNGFASGPLPISDVLQNLNIMKYDDRCNKCIIHTITDFCIESEKYYRDKLFIRNLKSLSDNLNIPIVTSKENTTENDLMIEEKSLDEPVVNKYSISLHPEDCPANVFNIGRHHRTHSVSVIVDFIKNQLMKNNTLFNDKIKNTKNPTILAYFYTDTDTSKLNELPYIVHTMHFSHNRQNPAAIRDFIHTHTMFMNDSDESDIIAIIVDKTHPELNLGTSMAELCSISKKYGIPVIATEQIPMDIPEYPVAINEYHNKRYNLL